MEDGALAVLIVEEDLRLALGPALTLLQKMVASTVEERLIKHKIATRILVQVTKIFCRRMEIEKVSEHFL